MGHFLDVAYRVLRHEGQPLSPDEITEFGLKWGWLTTRGKTPAQSMKARLSMDILDKELQSRFMRTASGKFGLRQWHGEHAEFVSQRFKKSLLEEDIVVFPAVSLYKYVPGPGLHLITPRNRRSLIAELESMKRSLAEERYDVIQLVSVFVVRFGEEYLTYKRTKRLPENRLHGSYSMSFGGHLNPEDILPLFDIFDSKMAHFVMNRELQEEIRFQANNSPELRYRGLLYDNSRDVSRQHLGVVYDVKLGNDNFQIGERGFLMDAKFETLEEIEARRGSFENWSWILMDSEKRGGGQAPHE